MNTSKQVVLAVTGASGACYAQRFLERASALEGVAVHVALTDTARDIWRYELGCEPPQGLDNRRFDHPFCSGSSAADVVTKAKRLVEEKAVAARMIQRQLMNTNPHAAETIAETILGKGKEPDNG